MDLTHEFTVPAGQAATWTALRDLESVAGCFPGATITSVEDDTFAGSVKVKLGPIALVYNGSGSFTELDEDAGRMVLDAKGKDKRGNGTAGAGVTVQLTEVSAEETSVSVVTDLQITGKPAQFGRGVIEDVSDKLLRQFVECLAGRFEAPGAGELDQAAEPVSAPTGAAAVTAASEAGTGDQDAGAASAPQPAAAPPRADDSLDLGATVLPALIRSYGKQVIGGLGAVAVLLLLLRWLRRR